MPPTAGTQAQTLRVGIVAYQYSVAELVAVAPPMQVKLVKKKKRCRAAEPILLLPTRVRVK